MGLFNRHRHEWEKWSDIIKEEWYKSIKGYTIENSDYIRQVQIRKCLTCGEIQKKYLS